MTPTAAALAVLATARLTLLVTRDSWPLGAFRDWLDESQRFDGMGRWAADLIVCPWCVSAYAGAAVAVWAWQGSGEWWFTVPAVALAGSLVAGVIGEALERG